MNIARKVIAAGIATAVTLTATGALASGTQHAPNATATTASATCSSDVLQAGQGSPARTVPAGCSVMTFRLRGGTLFTEPPTFPSNPLVQWRYDVGDLVMGSVPIRAGDSITLKPADREHGPGTFALYVAGREVAIAAGGGTTATSHVDAGVKLISITKGQTVFGAEPNVDAGVAATFK